MTNSEFSDAFSTLLNSYNTQAQFGEQASREEIVLNEYEKSILLTQAQDLVVKSYFDRTLNSQGQGFDDSTRRQVDFGSLIRVMPLQRASSSSTVIDSVEKIKRAYMGDDDYSIDYGNCTIKNITDHPLHVKMWGVTESSTTLGNHPFGYADINGTKAIYEDSINALNIGIYGDTLKQSFPSSFQEGIQDIKQNDVYDTSGNVLGNVGSFIDIILETDNATPGGVPATDYLDVTFNATSHTVDNDTYDSRGRLYKMPAPKYVRSSNYKTDVLFILNEQVIVDGKTLVVVPISYSQYDRLMSKPYSQPLKKQAWRLLHNSEAGYDIQSELILHEKYKNASDITYKIRYVRRPRPIILETLPDDLRIDGLNEETECEIDPVLHVDILNKAVELAIATRGGGSSRPTTEVINK